MWSEVPAALRRVLALTGLRFPRGVLGEEAWRLAAAVRERRDADIPGLVRATARALWPALRAPTEAAVARGLERAAPDDAAAFDAALSWARREDPLNPLALALALQAGADLAAALTRAAERVAALDTALGGSGEEAAVARAAGIVVVDLLDLDPEDFEPEIAAYLEAGETVEALRSLSRATGDADVRTWAREALAGLDLPGAGAGLAALRRLASGSLPGDPAEDPVWTAAVQALAEQAIAVALAFDADPG
jgi:hypothetical protein